MTNIVNAEVDGHQLTDVQIGSFMVLLASAGNDTTKQTTSHAFKALADNPDQKKAWLTADFDVRIAQAVEEFIRWATPVLNFARHATVDTELAGTQIKAGRRSRCSTARPTATTRCSTGRVSSTSPDHRTHTSVSVAAGRTSASARTSPGPSCGSCSTSSSPGYPRCRSRAGVLAQQCDSRGGEAVACQASVIRPSAAASAMSLRKWLPGKRIEDTIR